MGEDNTLTLIFDSEEDERGLIDGIGGDEILELA